MVALGIASLITAGGGGNDNQEKITQEYYKFNQPETFVLHYSLNLA